MASFRKKYQPQFESRSGDDGPPVLSPPPGGDAKLPDPVEAKPPEPIETDAPAEKAAQSALKARLAEMERAVELSSQATQQPPQHVAEPQQQPQEPTFEEYVAQLPPRVQRWCKADSRYLTDPEKISQVQYCHWIAKRETGEEFTDSYYDRMDQMLGFANGHAQKPTPPPAPMRPAPMRPAPQQRLAAPVSAPPTREAPSYSTGRSPSHRLPLTKDELEIAAGLGISAEEYERQKRKMEAMKAAGQLDDRR